MSRRLRKIAKELFRRKVAVPPHLVRDVKDLQADNPGLSWATTRE